MTCQSLLPLVEKSSPLIPDCDVIEREEEGTSTCMCMCHEEVCVGGVGGVMEAWL